ncbi:MAG: DUF2029 domain-containing protein [Deltaproteobacteria bacterium]|nr:DUF2029 domain-containing protein [Deltaproteobacteria bacterium]
MAIATILKSITARMSPARSAPLPSSAGWTPGREALLAALLLLIACLAECCAWTMQHTWIKRDGRFYVNVNTTLVERRSLDQRGFADSWYTGELGWNRNLDSGWSNVSLGRNGEHWPKHPFLLPLLSTPLFYAFGLWGTLLFNLLALAAAAGAGMAWMRLRGQSTQAPWASLVAVVVFVFLTSIREYAYDYHVDVLLLALWLGALLCLHSRRGVPAGALYGLCLVIKPTCLILAPSLLLLVCEQRAWRGLLRAGAALLAVGLAWGAVNTWMFGRPWWTGYHRVLSVVAGKPTVVTHTELFTTPWLEGLERIWSGHWGLYHRYVLLALALPGLVLLARRRPWYTASALLGLTASLTVFAFYRYEGDRFHWPAMALLLPALAESLDSAGRLLVRLSSRLLVAWREAPEAWIAALLAPAWLAGTLLAGWPASRRLGDPGLLGVPGGVAYALVCTACAAFFAARLGRRLALPGLAAALVLCAFAMPALRVDLLGSGLLLTSAALGFAALDSALLERWHAAAVLAALCDWTAGMPGPASAAVLWLALWSDRRTALRVAIVCAACLGAAMVADLLSGAGLLDCTLVLVVGRGLGQPASLGSLGQALVDVGPARSLWPLLLAAPVGLALAIGPRTRAASAVAILLALLTTLDKALLKPGAPSPAWALCLVLLAAPALESAVRGLFALGKRLRLGQPGRALAASAALLALLFLVGLARDVIASLQPFRLASVQTLRRAEVDLAGIPCDFMAWEHMSWECSHHDNTVFSGMVGLGLPEGLHVRGQRRDLLLIPTGRRGRRRTVRIPKLRAGRAFQLLHCVPDGLRGHASVSVSAGDRLLDRFEVPASTDGEIRTRRLDTAELAGQRIELVLQVESLDRQQAAVAFDGGWIDE